MQLNPGGHEFGPGTRWCLLAILLSLGGSCGEEDCEAYTQAELAQDAADALCAHLASCPDDLDQAAGTVSTAGDGCKREALETYQRMVDRLGDYRCSQYDPCGARHCVDEMQKGIEICGTLEVCGSFGDAYIYTCAIDTAWE